MAQGGVAGAPGAEESQADQGTGDGAVLCGEWGGQGEDALEGFLILWNGVWRMRVAGGACGGVSGLLGATSNDEAVAGAG